MPEYEFDFTDSEGAFELIPDGTYTAYVADVTEGKGDKGPYLGITYRISEGDYEGQTVFETLSFSPKAAWKARQTLKALLGREMPREPVTIDTKELYGRPCRIITKQRSYEGEMRNSVRSVLPPPSEAVTDLFEDTEPASAKPSAKPAKAKAKPTAKKRR